ncbi:MAG: hypothetical protein ACI8RN_000027 [Glaciecola sp.]|jgi:hypothetical protein|uniref:hypothetical protein n=1 Tax=Congregibacter sp. TaxID=2744308 RepID=UPI0039E5F19B
MARREQSLIQRVVNTAVRTIIALALFVLHHTALVIEFLLRQRAKQMAHAVGFQPQHQIERRRGHGLEIVRSIE